MSRFFLSYSFSYSVLSFLFMCALKIKTKSKSVIFLFCVSVIYILSLNQKLNMCIRLIFVVVLAFIYFWTRLIAFFRFASFLDQMSLSTVPLYNFLKEIKAIVSHVKAQGYSRAVFSSFIAIWVCLLWYKYIFSVWIRSIPLKAAESLFIQPTTLFM